VRNRYVKIGIALVLAGAALAGAMCFLPGERIVPPSGPRLAVVLVFDQLRGDYLDKWQKYFGDGGFKRLQSEGAWFSNCHYPYAHTVTAAGHASLLTGCTPRDHGVVGNSWYDRRQHKKIECVTGERGKGPFHRKQPTLGDVLLERYKKSKVAALSIKDRGAILLAALKAQICCWLVGRDFVTSDFYGDERRWVKRFNSSKKIDTFIGRDWAHLRSDLNYEDIAGPDDVEFECRGAGQGRTFPHPTPIESAVTLSPFGNDLLLDLARIAIDEEKLGQRTEPDLLCLSFSSNDLVGHCYGPDSQEVFDMTLRSDLIVKAILDLLDQKVGKGNYVVALSADHGICPIPGVAKSQGKDAGYVPSSFFSSESEKFLKDAFGQRDDSWIEMVDGFNIHLNQAVVEAVKTASPAEVVKALADHLAQQPGIQAAFTRGEILQDKVLEDPIAEMVRQSATPDTCGDVVVVLKPYYLLGNLLFGTTGTTHGAPYPYDTHVPLLAMGPGIKPGKYGMRVAPQSMAFILARVLAIDPPAGARKDFAPPEEMWQ
jgi:hypothetical protein